MAQVRSRLTRMFLVLKSRCAMAGLPWKISPNSKHQNLEKRISRLTLVPTIGMWRCKRPEVIEIIMTSAFYEPWKKMLYSQTIYYVSFIIPAPHSKHFLISNHKVSHVHGSLSQVWTLSSTHHLKFFSNFFLFLVIQRVVKYMLKIGQYLCCQQLWIPICSRV